MTTVIPWASRPQRVAENIAALNKTIAGDFLRDADLVNPTAPLPV